MRTDETVMYTVVIIRYVALSFILNFDSINQGAQLQIDKAAP